MSAVSRLRRSARKSPFWPVVTHPRLRKIWPGIGVSAVGGGMSSVVVSWLAIELAPVEHRALWVGAAITANTLPAAVGALTLGRWVGGWSGPQLAGCDALVRFVVLLLVPVLHLVGLLRIEAFVGLLAVASVLAAWGKAGRYTMLSEVLDKEHRLAGNAFVNLLLEGAVVIGPLLATVLINRVGAPAALGVIALSWGVLAFTYRAARVPETSRPPEASASRSAGLRVMLEEPRLLALISLSFGFFFCFGPASVAIPLHVVEYYDETPSVLAGFYTAFGAGAVLGTLAIGHLKNRSMMGATIMTVLGFGCALGIVSLGKPVVTAWAAFGVCGLFWGPFPSTTTAVFQELSPPRDLPQVLAARGAALSIATPLGAMLGAPLTLLLGTQQTLRLSAVGLVGLGILALVVNGVGRRRSSRPEIRRRAHSVNPPRPREHRRRR